MCKKKVRSIGRACMEMLLALIIGTKSFVVGYRGRIRSAINKTTTFSTSYEYYNGTEVYRLTVMLKSMNVASTRCEKSPLASPPRPCIKYLWHDSLTTPLIQGRARK